MTSRLRSGPAWTACAVLLLAGCNADGSGARAEGQVDVGQVEQVPATALDVDSRAEVALPSGVLTLGLAPGVEEVETDDGTLAPAGDVDLVGVTWSFTPHPSSEARSVLLAGDGPESLPEPTVALLDSSEPVPVPVVAQAGRSGGAVVGASDPAGVLVTYDGLEQRVDLGSGAVDAGQAEGLGDLEAATTPLRRACPADAFPPAQTLENGCRVEAVHRLPYVAGLGWAPDSQDWLVVDARIDGEATLRLGDDEGRPLVGAPASVTRVAFAVAGNAPRAVGFDFGRPTGVVSVPLGD